MNEQNAGSGFDWKMEGAISRMLPGLWPPLALETADRARPLYSPIGPDHRLYPLAAWAFHHADELDHDQRDGLLESLAYAWPARGRRKHFGRQAWFVMLHSAGLPIDAIADKWHLAKGHVQDIIRDGLRPGPEVSPFRIEAISNRETLREPFDPVNELGRNAVKVLFIARHPSDDWRLADELARELGFRSATSFVKTMYDGHAKMLAIHEARRRQQGT